MITIDVLWVYEKTPDFVSRMVMKMDKAPFSHVMVQFKDRFGVPSIYHATGEGVNIIPLKGYMATHGVYGRMKVQLKMTKEFFWGYISGSDGKEYSHWQLVRIATGVKMFKNGKQKMICSETVGELLHFYSSWKLSGERDLWTPKYLYNVLHPRSGI